MKKIRLTVDLTPEAYAVLDDLQQKLELSSKSDVFRVSIKALDGIMEMREQGWEFYARKDGAWAPIILAGFSRKVRRPEHQEEVAAGAR